jgi:hypothetical protein
MKPSVDIMAENRGRLVYNCILHETDTVRELYDACLTLLVRMMMHRSVLPCVKSSGNVIIDTKLRCKGRPLQVVISDSDSSQSEYDTRVETNITGNLRSGIAQLV